MMSGVHPTAVKQLDTDCYYYYYSSCTKGSLCGFRHEPSALGSETVCIHWLKGNCSNRECSYRHMKITKKRDEIQCYHENQPGGCSKPHCPFLHKKKNRPLIAADRVSDKQKNWKQGTAVSLNRKSASKDSGLPHKNQRYGTPLDDTSILNLSRNKNKGHSRQASSVNNLCELNAPTISRSVLVNRLASWKQKFKAPIHYVCSALGCDEYILKQFALMNSHVFAVSGSEIELRPKIKICETYTSKNGCLARLHCRDLHICPNYVLSSCNDSNSCILGHFLKTDHNKIILEKFFINYLSDADLFELLHSLGPSIYKVMDSVRICEDYNVGNCETVNCAKLHLCLAYLAEKCSENDSCKLNHKFMSADVCAVLQAHGMTVRENPKDIMKFIINETSVKGQLKLLSVNLLRTSGELCESAGYATTKWSHHFIGETAQSEICFSSVEDFCQLEDAGCPKLHATCHFHWQVKKEGHKWVNLRMEQVIALEKAYCDPEKDSVELPPLDPASLDMSVRDLLSLMQGRKKWNACFYTMKLSLSGTTTTLELRRLCSEKVVKTPQPLPCIFLWYFLDVKNKWIEYGNIDSTGDPILKCTCNSADIEKHFSQTRTDSIIVSSLKFSYSLDFGKMIQTNVRTKVQRRMRRRPKPHIIVEGGENTNDDTPSNWDPMLPLERVKIVTLSSSSAEYQKISDFYAQHGGGKRLLDIKRVQNPFLLKPFLNKVKEMTAVYKSEDKVNIQQLFHGTKPDIVAKICEENFDWRLHGTSTGQSYGRGTYFSPLPSTSYGYTRPDASGSRFMFIAKVAVGTLTQGNSAMVRPPVNPLTNTLYDSTVDHVSKPSIIVKYDKQEYYPEYILTVT